MSGSVAAGDAVEDDDEDDVVTVKCPPQRIPPPSLQIESGSLKYVYILGYIQNVIRYSCQLLLSLLVGALFMGTPV